MEVDTEIEKLKVLETAHRKKQYASEKFLTEQYPKEILRLNNIVENIKLDSEYIESIQDNFTEENFEIEIKGNKYTDKEKAGALLIQVANNSNIDDLIGEYKEFKIYSNSTQLSSDIKLVKNTSHSLSLNIGYKKANIDSLDKCLNSCKDRLENINQKIKKLNEEKEQIEKSCKLPFEHKETLENLLKEKMELEKEFDEENKTCVQFEDEKIEEQVIEQTENYEIEM